MTPSFFVFKRDKENLKTLKVLAKFVMTMKKVLSPTRSLELLFKNDNFGLDDTIFFTVEFDQELLSQLFS